MFIVYRVDDTSRDKSYDDCTSTVYTHSKLSIFIYTVYKLYKCRTVILEVTDAIN